MIETGRGLRGVAFIFVGQQVLASVLIIPVALRYLDRRMDRPFALEQVAVDHELLRQAAGRWRSRHWSSREVDSLVIGGALSVRALGLYSPGANFANQLSSVATNALGPAAVHLGNVYGRDGRRRHVPGVQAAPADVGRGGHGLDHGGDGRRLFRHLGLARAPLPLAGWIAIVLTAGAAVPLVTALIGSYITAIGKAGALARYGVVSMVVNIVLTVPWFCWVRSASWLPLPSASWSPAVYMLHDVRRYRAARPPQPSALRPIAERSGGGSAHPWP